MSLRFWRRVRIAPGVTLNLSMSTASVSIGPRGAKYTFSPLGNRATLGLPGTGLFYTVRDASAPAAAQTRPAASRPAPARHPLDLGLLQRLRLPRGERLLVDGLRHLQAGRAGQALAVFEGLPEIADAAWLAGVLCLQRDDPEGAQRHMQRALEQPAALGRFCTRYGIAAEVTLPITRHVTAHLAPSERAARLVLAELAQRAGRRRQALEQLEPLIRAQPDDAVVRVSFAELALDPADDPALLERLVALTQVLDNDCHVQTTLLLYRAQALSLLGVPHAAVDALTLALRRRKGRAESLMQQVRFERAVLYERLGQRAQARREFERLFGENPGFPGLRARLAGPG